MRTLMVAGCLVVFGGCRTGSRGVVERVPVTTGSPGFERVVTVACDRSIRCGAWDPTLEQECTTLFKGIAPYSDLIRAGARGAIVLAHPECLDQAAVAPCEGRVLCDPASSSGRILEGGGCSVSEECATPGTECAGSNACGRTCQRVGGPSQRCRQKRCGSPGCCDEGLYCEPSTVTCLAPPGADAPCGPGSPCVDGLYCDGASRRCTMPPAAGQPCLTTGAPPCAPGASCNPSGICFEAPAAGQPCGSFSPSCNDEAYCAGGTCAARRGRGEFCTAHQQCRTDLVCDAVVRTCLPSGLTWDLGDPCTGSELQCVRLVCAGARPNPDGGVGTMGTCQRSLAKLGEGCSKGEDCPDRSTCLDGVCAVAMHGSPCDFDSNCPAGEFCSPANTCISQLRRGDACDAGTLCASGTLCADLASEPGNFRCRAPGGVGAACGTELRYPGHSHMLSTCLLPNSCVEGHCVHVGGPGERCLGDDCFAGSCQRDNSGGSPVRLCGAKAPDGARCTNDQSCASGRCDGESRTCVTCP